MKMITTTEALAAFCTEAAKHPYQDVNPVQWYHHDGAVADW